MKHFETIAELHEATKLNQLTAQHVINKRAIIDGQWQDFTISAEAYFEFVDAIVSVLGGRAKTKCIITSILTYTKPQHWGFGRMVIRYNASNNTYRWDYIAGQSYPDEIRTIRGFLKK
jgi:hypothetical protein